MDLYDQIKTANGSLPTKNAQLGTARQRGSEQSCVQFSLYSPEELASQEAAPQVGVTPALENLGFLLEESEDCSEIKMTNLHELAVRLGPLFGRSNQESIKAWQCASTMAHDVVKFQDAINGNKSLTIVDKRVVKTVVSNTQAGTGFIIYSVSFEVGSGQSSEYENFLPRLPGFKKFKCESSVDYVFIQRDRVGEVSLLSVFLIAFASEITTLDFALVLGYLKQDITIEQETINYLGKQAGFDDPERFAEATSGTFAAPGVLVEREILLDEIDIPHIQKLVHALISLHLQGITIDVFRSNEANEFMVFENLLSYLWYEFSRKFERVKIGYCEQCGKGFSLSGHRGISRRFCCEACKTQAKNARAKNQRDEVRQRFRRGESVVAIAKACYPLEKPTEAAIRIRKQLCTWKELRRYLDTAILFREDGLELLNHCMKEKIFTQAEILARAQILSVTPYLKKQAKQFREEEETWRQD